MLSSKWTGLKSLVSLSLDGAYFCQTLTKHDHDCTEDSELPQVAFASYPAPFNKLESQPQHTQIHNGPPQIVWKSVTRPLIPASFSPKRAFSCRSKLKHDQSVQTDIPVKEAGDLPIVSQQLSSLFHHLNSAECSRMSQSNMPSSDDSVDFAPPPVWLSLGELDYSPALFNLGVWYERQFLALPSTDVGARSKFLQKAEQSYGRALMIDEHPTAAYNLACLLLSSNRKQIQIGLRVYSVDELMNIAARHDISQAKKYLNR
ncbi:hypothetical protein PHET_04532 [Paragonimus heterotremus]|uniref:Uncharacterized protein n=1 Tax=Paragonimus heterotremus TaxID=100268 RepID=A0A8J4TIH6_9TREM|nr:hypothetical protein PHET_04532 [Paragonimus heterotremus]